MSLQDLIVSKTRDEMLEEELTVAVEEGLQTTTWQSGSIIRTLMVIMAAMFSMFSKIIIEPIKGGFGDLVSSMAWAKIWAKENYDVDIVEAEPATGFIVIVNASAHEYPLDAGDLIVAHITKGKLYRNDEDIVIEALSTSDPIAITAQEIGTGSNAGPGVITFVVGPSMDGVTVSNPLPVLGADEEKVGALVIRSRSKLAALSPLGPKDAYNYVVKTPEFCATGTPITRASTFVDPITGDISVYVATATGAPSGGDITICQAAVEKWAEPWGDNATVYAASEVVVPVTYQVWIPRNLTVAQIETAIADALSDFFAATDIGGLIISPYTGKIYKDSLQVVNSKAKIGDNLIGVVRCVIQAPSADVSLDKNEVAVLGTIIPTVNFL